MVDSTIRRRLRENFTRFRQASTQMSKTTRGAAIERVSGTGTATSRMVIGSLLFHRHTVVAAVARAVPREREEHVVE